MAEPDEAGTKPRVLEFYNRGPGPAAYRLPPLLGRSEHAVTHQIRPEYTLRSRYVKEFYTPGPGVGKYKIDWGLKANGKYLGPEFTMRQKLKDQKRMNGPGPADHELPPIEVCRPRTPGYTMRIRTPCFKQGKSPGPNVYVLPSLLGPRVVEKSAQQEVSMKGKPGSDEVFKARLNSPGPAAYSPVRPETVKPRAPEFTMPSGSRPKTRWSPACSPASYDPTRKVYRQEPAYSFGIRYTEFMANMYTECDKAHQLHRTSRSLYN